MRTLPVLVVAALAISTQAASMNVHSLVGFRALRYYSHVSRGAVAPGQAALINDVLQAHPNSVAAGSDFPDFMYACNSKFADHHDEGEAAHWPPFHAVATRYIRSLPDFHGGDVSRWSDDTKKLVSFVFGLAVHFVTDELWEGLTPQLGPGWGFIESVDYLNGGGSGHGDVNENLGNMGADFYTAWALNESLIKPWEREFPLDHLVNIYHITPKSTTNVSAGNFTDVNLAALEECQELFDLGLWALKNLGPLAFPTYNRLENKLPIIAERVFKMPLSGVDDMATLVGFAWNRIASWLLTRVPASETPVISSSADDDQDGRLTYRLFHALAPFATDAGAVRALAHPAAVVQAALGGGDVDVAAAPEPLRQTLRGMLTAVVETIFSESTTEAIPNIDELLQDYIQSAQPAPRQMSPIPTQSTTGAAAVQYHGSALATGDFDGDGTPDLAIGRYGASAAGAGPYPSGTADRPRMGVVEIQYGGARSRRSLLTLPETLARFGWSMATVDFNLDGVDDLAIGAPGASDWNASSFGPFPESPASTNWTPGATTFRLRGKVAVVFGIQGKGLSTATAPLSLVASEDLVALGTTVTTGDFDGDGHPDLLLGCPLASDDSRVHPGRVYGVRSSQRWAAGTSIAIEKAANFRIAGPAEFGWFGQSVAVSGKLLVVGAPFSRNDTGSAVGKVYGYALDPTAAPSSRFTITGSVALGEFGHSIAAAGSFVVLAAPDAQGNPANKQFPDRSGMVGLLDSSVTASLVGNYTVNDLPWYATIHGTEAYGRLGYAMDFDGHRLALGAPFRGGLGLATKETGSAFVWNTLPDVNSTVDTTSASWSVDGTRVRARLGSSVQLVGTTSAAVGSPTATVNRTEGVGAVDVFVTE